MTKQIEAQQITPAIDIYDVMEQIAATIEPEPFVWAALVQQVALHLHGSLPEGSTLPDRDKHAALIDQAVPRSSPVWGGLHDGASETGYEAVEFGARLGYALAKTWPDSPDGFAGWPAAA